MKFLRFIKISPILVGSISVLSATYTTGANQFSDQDYKVIKDIYAPYYNSSVVQWQRNSKYTNDSKDYNKVGIIEVNNFDEHLLLSKNPYFSFTRINPDKELIIEDKKGYHAHSVLSIIGTDLGINKNAKLYFDHLKRTYKNNKVRYTNLFQSIKKMYENYGVKLINMSLGPDDNPFIYHPMSDSVSIKRNYFTSSLFNNSDIFYLARLGKILLFHTFNNDINFKTEASKHVKEKYEAIGAYAAKKDLKLVLSSGNLNSSKIYDSLIDGIKFYVENNFSNGGKIDWDLFDNKVNTIFKASTETSFEEPNQPKKNHVEASVDELRYIIFLYFYINNRHGLTRDNNNIVSILDKNDSLIYSIYQGVNEWSTAHTNDNFINVGAVNYKNIPAEFSTYGHKEQGKSPIISSYGESIKNDYEYILEKENENNVSPQYRYPMTEILKIIEAVKDKQLKEHLNQFTYFRGTSKSAPMVTGLLSELQRRIKRNLSLPEAKVIISAGSTYSPVKTDKNSPWHKHSKVQGVEQWNFNKSKSKTGFGIPRFANMVDVANSKYLSKLSTKKTKIERDVYNSYELKNVLSHKFDYRFKNLVHTISVVPTMSFYDFYPDINHLIDKESTINLYDIESELKYKYVNESTINGTDSGSTYKSRKSNSRWSNTERMYYKGYEDMESGEYRLDIKLTELNKIRLALFDKWDSDSSFVKKTLIKVEKMYKKYIDKCWNIYSYLGAQKWN